MPDTSAAPWFQAPRGLPGQEYHPNHLLGGYRTSGLLGRYGFASEPLHTVLTDNQSVAASGGTLTLANVTGCGVMRSLWMAIGNGTTANMTPLLDGRVQIIVDGITEMDADFGTLFLTHGNGTPPATPYQAATQHLGVELLPAGYELALNWFFPVPFQQSLVVKVVNSTSVALNNVWAQIAYTTQPPPAGFKFHTFGVTFVNHISLSSTQTTDFCNVGGPGWLAWFSMYTQGSTDVSWLERDVQAFIDGETNPSVTSSGTEDWFRHSFGTQGRSGFATPWSIVGVAHSSASPFDFALGLDLLQLWGGLYFRQGLRLHWATEAACDTSSTTSYVGIYYTGAP